MFRHKSRACASLRALTQQRKDINTTMFTGKGLLLFCIVMMHISFTASKPFKREISQEHMTGPMMASARCNLKTAEKYYVAVMFNGTSPDITCSQSPLEGITFGNTTEEVQTSACAIANYLDKPLGRIVKHLTNKHGDILENTKNFLKVFKPVVKESSDQNNPKQCHRNVTASDDYSKKQIGFKIIHCTHRWVENYTGTKTVCQQDA